ncbi:TPA: hypothetical protein ACH27V_000856 [Klebsiella quasipneumoniae subsp. similipneumoniae]
MTSKFSIDNRDLLQRISSGEAVVGIDFGNLIVRELAAFRLAAMDIEPVAEITEDLGRLFVKIHHPTTLKAGDKLYRHAQPAQISALKLPPKLSNDRESSHELNTGVDTWNRCIDEVAKINGEMIIAGRLDGLHPSTAALVNDFATALAEKLRKAELKYGYSNAWTNNGWMTDCLADFHRHIAKGDPRDVAAYCAFMWYHGWKTEAAQPAPVVPEEWTIADAVKFCKETGRQDAGAAMDAWNAFRAAMLQAGSSPAQSPIDHGYRPECDCSGCKATSRICAELSANSSANPGCWCRTCRPVVLNDMRFVVCPDCGNKRCPRANDHRNACTGSNEPGQEGGAYPDTPQEVKP